MAYYPLFLDLSRRNVLVVGGGSVAQRKVALLLQFEASVFLVAKEMTDVLRDQVNYKNVQFLGTTFIPEHLEDVFMVFAATDDTLFNHRISEMARKKGVLVNAVDQPEDCDFIVPSLIKRGALSIAFSTSGKSPALAKRLREKLEPQFGKEYGLFLELMGLLRKEILTMHLTQQENRAIFQDLIDSEILSFLKNDNWEAVKACLLNIFPKNKSVEMLVAEFEKSVRE